MITTDDILKMIREYTQRKTDEAKNTLKSKMLARDREVGGKGHISLSLVQSIASYIDIVGNYIEFGIQMDDYGMFVDKGVRGKETTYPESKDSPFQFKSKMPPTKVFSGAGGWISRKGILDRSDIASKSGKKGKSLSKKMISMNKSLAYVIARNIKKKGIKGYHFSDVVFDKNDLELLINKIMEKTGQDIITNINI